MGKIWLVFKQDLKNIFTNGTTFIAIVILLIVPAFFAAFIIKANWVPINSSKEIKIALVNKDRGGMIYNDIVNIGDKITENLGRDSHLSWDVVPYEEAFRGFLIGDFYSMIVIPEEFTQGIATIITDTPTLPKISYMINARENVFTPTFTETSSTMLRIKVAQNIVYAINDAVQSVLGEFDINFTINNTEIKDVVETLLDLDANREFYIEKIREYRELIGSMMVVLTNLRSELPSLTENIGNVESMTKEAQRFFDMANELEASYVSDSERNSTLQPEKAEEIIGELKEIAAYIKEEIPKIEDMVNDSGVAVAKVYGIFSQVDATLTNITKNLHGLEYKLGFLAEDSDINKLIYMLENDPQLVKASIESPALLERNELEKLPNYGSSLAPFNITVAMWMGTTALLTMFSTRVQADVPELKTLTNIQEYFGKGLFFIVLAGIQDLTIIISCKRILGIYIKSYFIFLGIGIIGSITFTVLIYTLVSVFGNTGKVITYMISVLQLFFLGGVYPTQIVPPLFRNINKVLPFIYVIGSFREAQMGIITDNLLKSGLILLIFILCAIAFGLLGRTILAPSINNVRQKVRASHLGKQDY